MKTKFTAIIIAIIMIISSVPFTATFAEEADNFVYFVENGEVTITDYNGDPEGILTVPDEIEGKPVTIIGDHAFCNLTKITSVVLPETIKMIDLMAFSDSGITNINIPASVEEIISTALSNCAELKSITVDENNKHFSADENGILYNKDKTELIIFPRAIGFKEFTIPDSVTTIGTDAFNGNVEIEKVNFNSGLRVIGSHAFYGCEKLDNIELPSQLESIGQTVFGKTAYFLDSANWEDSVLYMDKYLICSDHTLSGKYEIKDGTVLVACFGLDYNPELTEIVIPASVKILNDDAFVNNSKLEKIEIPQTVEVIGDDLLRNCSSLKSIEIPAGVTKIGDFMFDGCTGLEEIILPDGLTEIGESAFGICEALKEITLPDSVTKIGGHAFDYCRALEKINMSDGVTYIGPKAFNATAIKSFELPEGVTKIEPAVFSQCNKLEEVTIHKNLTEISDFAFDGCSNLKTVNYEGTQEQWKEIKIGEQCNEALFNATINYGYISNGDIDANNKINSADALLVLQSVAGLVTLNENQRRAAELNNDEKITSADALVILQYVTGKITKI